MTASQPVESDQNQEESQVNGEGVETEASTETLSRLSRSGHSRKEKLEARSRDQEDVEESLENQEDEKPFGALCHLSDQFPCHYQLLLSVLLGMVHVALPFINLVATNQQTRTYMPVGRFLKVKFLMVISLGSMVCSTMGSVV